MRQNALPQVLLPMRLSVWTAGGDAASIMCVMIICSYTESDLTPAAKISTLQKKNVKKVKKTTTTTIIQQRNTIVLKSDSYTQLPSVGILGFLFIC